MLTECPSCQTVFRVTGAILKIGHGQVRCGKCRTQFDALDSLLDEDQFAAEELLASRAKTESAAKDSPRESLQASKDQVVAQEAAQDAAQDLIDVRPPDIAEEITLEGSRIEISGVYRVAHDSADASDNTSEQIIHEHVVIDRDEPTALDDVQQDRIETQTIDIGADDGEPVADAARHLLADTAGKHANEPGTGPAPLSQRIWQRARDRMSTQSTAEHRKIAAELAALTQPEPVPTPHRTLWLALSIGLAITMIAQAVHHNRDPLVRSPKWGGVVSRVYRGLGLTLTPNWDLSAYELQVWDVTLGNSRDTLRVRASVTNNAPFAQPYPLIKLALEDRWGTAVGLRAFTPEEYLPTGEPANRMMAPRQRANAEIAVVDPGADAVGFQSRPCLAQNGGIVCSDDAPFAR